MHGDPAPRTPLSYGACGPLTRTPIRRGGFVSGEGGGEASR